MKYEEYIMAIAPFEDFKNRAHNCNDNKFKSKLMEAYDKGLREIGRSYFLKEAETARKDYNNRIKNLTNKFFKDNNIPLKVGDRVIVVNGKVGTIVSLHTESYKYIRYYKYIPMIKIELDENKDLEYIAALSNIKKI